MDVKTNLDMLLQADMKDWHYYEMQQKCSELLTEVNRRSEKMISDDMKTRIIDAAESAVLSSYEDSDFVDRTVVETEVLAGLLKMVKEQQKTIDQYHKADTFLEAHGWKW